jgi:peptidoglycan/LPS O-acetylase OafA/YrhL
MKTLPALTGMRFVAALLVLLYHFVRLPGAPVWLNNLFAEGYRGVEFFFVLSGFVLGYNYLPRADTLKKREFWTARVARIGPLYWLSLAVSLPLLLRFMHVELQLDHGQVAAYGLLYAVVTVPMLQTLTPINALAQGWNTPAWSLSIEALCYLCFPALVVLLHRSSRAKCWAIAVTCVCTLFAFDWLLPHLPQYGTLWGLPGQWLWRCTPVYNFPMFLLGVALSRVFLLHTAQQHPNSPTRVHTAWLSAASTLVTVLTLLFFASGWSRQAAPLATGLSVALFALLVYLLAFGCGPVATILSRPMAKRLGDASFALYLLENPIKTYLQQVYSKVLGASVESLTFYVPLVAVTIATSLLVHRTFELPAKTRLQAFFARRFQHATIAAAQGSPER